MHTTQRYLYQPGDLEGAARALDFYDQAADVYVRVIYTCEDERIWRYCIGQCVMGSGGGRDTRQDYPRFVFISKVFRGLTLKTLLESLGSTEGLRITADLPSVRLPQGESPNWREAIVPSHATSTGMPARRFQVSIEQNAVFSESQLVAFDQPYHRSAERQAKAFLRLNPRESLERGEFTIEVPEMRGRIALSERTIAIADAAMPMRLMGEVNDNAIDFFVGQTAEIDEKRLHSVELWLLAQGNVLIDYISTSHWPYRYAAPEEGKGEGGAVAVDPIR